MGAQLQPIRCVQAAPAGALQAKVLRDHRLGVQPIFIIAYQIERKKEKKKL